MSAAWVERLALALEWAADAAHACFVRLWLVHALAEQRTRTVLEVAEVAGAVLLLAWLW